MPKIYESEAQFSADVIKFFRAKLDEGGLSTVQVAERLKVLKDFTIGKDREGEWRLIAGFQEQDITFFVRSDSIAMSKFMSPAMRIDHYDRTGETPVTIPLAICELKLGSSLITHTLITYASISTQLQGIFPHCAYFFLMDSNRHRRVQPETVLRHCKGFDRVFLEWEIEKDKVWLALKAHFDYLSERRLLPMQS